MSAIRLARGYTGRDKIVKFEGCYHGHADSLLVKAGSGALTLGVPSSGGVPASLAEHTLTLRFNDIDSVTECFEELGDQIIINSLSGCSCETLLFFSGSLAWYCMINWYKPLYRRLELRQNRPDYHFPYR